MVLFKDWPQRKKRLFFGLLMNYLFTTMAITIHWFFVWGPFIHPWFMLTVIPISVIPTTVAIYLTYFVLMNIYTYQEPEAV